MNIWVSNLENPHKLTQNETDIDPYTSPEPFPDPTSLAKELLMLPIELLLLFAMAIIINSNSTGMFMTV